MLGQSFELGISATEEGDDRLHPTLTIHYEINDLAIIRLHHYGLDLDPIKERTTLLGMGYTFPFMKYKQLKGALGLSYLRKEIRLSEQDFQGGYDIVNNAGLMMGLFWAPRKDLPFTIAWESNVFFAGASSLLLTTARRQTIGISGGVSW